MRAVAHDLGQSSRSHTSHPEGSWATATRRLVRPVPVAIDDGFEPDDPYVRRYWVAAIGQGAVADLLRLVVAARRKVLIPEPTFLSTLISEGLASAVWDQVSVPDPIPPLGAVARKRLAPSLRAEHASFMLARVVPDTLE